MKFFLEKRTIETFEGKNKHVPENIINGSATLIILQEEQVEKEPIIWG